MLTPFEHSNHVAKYNIPEKLEIWTTCGPDDEFNLPKQIRYLPALGKIFVANSTTANFHVRNVDLSYSLKYQLSTTTPIGIDGDSSNIYAVINSATIHRWDLAWGGHASAAILGNGNPRMIDASGDPLNVYVTSNNAGDGHGVRKVRKSDMTVVASRLATGAGDGEFSNPLGIKYYDGYVYVCDVTNQRVQKLDASDLSYVAQYPYTYDGANTTNPSDLDTDGSNWYVSSANHITKRGMDFTYISNKNVTAAFYSICLVGNNIATVDNANSKLYLFQKSDFTQLSTVGSSGDGSASLFDPRVDFPSQYAGQARWELSDGTVLTATSGSKPSWNGFAGYTFQAPGPHRAVLKGVPVDQITLLHAYTDNITRIHNLNKMIRSTEIALYTNASLALAVDDLPSAQDCVTLHLATTDSKNHSLSMIASKMPSLTILCYYSGATLAGSLDDLAPMGGLRRFWAYGNPALVVGSGFPATLVNLRDPDVKSNGWLAADVDTVIELVWANRASYTYATPALNVGGTNAPPTGTYAAPSEGSNWHDDSGTWIPLTGNAMVYDLVNDVNSEGFNKWTITTS